MGTTLCKLTYEKITKIHVGLSCEFKKNNFKTSMNLACRIASLFFLHLDITKVYINLIGYLGYYMYYIFLVRCKLNNK